MKREDDLKFGILMASLGNAFNRKIEKDQITIYFNFLDDLSIQQLERAIEWTIKTNTRFPSISEIRSATLESVDLKAFMAWSEVLKLGGKYSSMPKFRDPIIPAVINHCFGGWENFNWYQQPNDYVLGQDRRHFITAYKLFHNQKERKALDSKQPKRLKE